VRAYEIISGLPLDEQVAALRDPELRARILTSHAALTSGDHVFPATHFSPVSTTRLSLTSPSTMTCTPATRSAPRRGVWGLTRESMPTTYNFRERATNSSTPHYSISLTEVWMPCAR
jgi:hypothetical protein